MIYYVIIDTEDGEEGGIFNKRSSAFAAVTKNNAMKYDMPYGGTGGFVAVPINAEPGTPKEVLYKMAKEQRAKDTEMKNKIESKIFDRFLGKDAIEEYNYKKDLSRLSSERLQEIYNVYYGGDMNDFRKSFKTITEVAQFLTYMIEMGTDIREIQRMVRVLE